MIEIYIGILLMHPDPKNILEKKKPFGCHKLTFL